MSAVRFRPRPPVKSLTGIENPAIFLVAGFFVVLADVTADVSGFRKSTWFLTVLALVEVVGTMPCAFAVKSKGVAFCRTHHVNLGDGSDLKSSPLPSRAESSADVPAFASSTVYKVGKPSDRGDT